MWTWTVINSGTPITLRQMAALFHFTHSKVATIQIWEKSFEATGLFPYNPDVFVDSAELTYIPAIDRQESLESDDDLLLSHIAAKTQIRTSEPSTCKHQIPKPPIPTLKNSEPQISTCKQTISENSRVK